MGPHCLGELTQGEEKSGVPTPYRVLRTPDNGTKGGAKIISKASRVFSVDSDGVDTAHIVWYTEY